MAFDGRKDKWAQRIAALLANAEDAAKRGNEAEVQAFLDKASALQLKFAINDAMLPTGDPGKETIVSEDFCRESNTPLIKAKRELINTISSWNRGKAVLCGEMQPLKSSQSGAMKLNKRAYVRVFAHESDLKFISMLYTSLILQMQTMMAADEALHADHGGKVANAWRVSYAYGWVSRIAGRLAEADARNRKDAASGGSGTELVLRDRRAAVLADVELRMGKLRRTHHRRDDRDANARSRGYESGGNADLGGKKVSSAGARQLGA